MKTSLHNIEVKYERKVGSGIQTGVGTRVYLDGQQIQGLKGYKHSVDATGFATITLELYSRDFKVTQVESFDDEELSLESQS